MRGREGKLVLSCQQRLVVGTTVFCCQDNSNLSSWSIDAMDIGKTKRIKQRIIVR